MKNITIGVNESGQRIDRFLRKYFNKMSLSTIQKYLRLKKIKLNNKRVKPDHFINEGDTVSVYISDEEFNNSIHKDVLKYKKIKLDIIYEDRNIIVINKNSSMLSHGVDKSDKFEKNIVDAMVEYLIEKGEYIPRLEKIFRPSVINRLDRNTSGIIIGCKNYETLKCLNEAMLNNKIKRFYKTIVAGKVQKDFVVEKKLKKNEEKNKVKISDCGKESVTKFKVISGNEKYSFLEAELITGRSHQIRVHLAFVSLPVIGDKKYGNVDVNDFFYKEFNLKHQILHSSKVVFNVIDNENLRYLSNGVFEADLPVNYKKIYSYCFENGR